MMQARRLQFILRDKPDCILECWMMHRGNMSMHEMMLTYEVAVPYLCHDLEYFGVPKALVVMWLLLRHGCMCFTRIDPQICEEDYQYQLHCGQACIVALAAVAEYHHTCDQPDKCGGCTTCKDGVNQFNFTWKLHQLAAHMKDSMHFLGHALQGSDMWAERLMRMLACRIIKCVPMLYLCATCLTVTGTTGRYRTVLCFTYAGTEYSLPRTCLSWRRTWTTMA